LPDESKTYPQKDILTIRKEFMKLCDKGLNTEFRRYYYYNKLSFGKPSGSYQLIIATGATRKLLCSTEQERLVLAIAPLRYDPKYAGAVYLTCLMLSGRMTRSPVLSERASKLFHTTGRPRRGWNEECEEQAKDIFRQLAYWQEVALMTLPGRVLCIEVNNWIFEFEANGVATASFGNATNVLARIPSDKLASSTHLTASRVTQQFRFALDIVDSGTVRIRIRDASSDLLDFQTNGTPPILKEAERLWQVESHVDPLYFKELRSQHPMRIH